MALRETFLDDIAAWRAGTLVPSGRLELTEALDVHNDGKFS